MKTPKTSLITGWRTESTLVWNQLYFVRYGLSYDDVENLGSPDNSSEYARKTENVPISLDLMSDEDIGPRHRMKDCTHYSLRTTPSDVDAFLKARKSSLLTSTDRSDTTIRTYVAPLQSPYQCYDKAVFGDAGKFNKGLPALYEIVGGELVIQDPPSLNVLLSDALKLITPHVTEELSLVNSIIELKDAVSIPRLGNQLNRTAKSFLQTVKGLSRSRQRSMAKFLKEASLSATDLFLQKSFNVDPFISDVGAVICASRMLASRITAILRDEGKPVRRHYYRDLAPVYSTEPEVVDGERPVYPAPLFSRSDETVNTHARHILSFTDEFRCHFLLTYRLTEMRRKYASFLGLLDSLGVKFNPSIVWNAIPWTFVVDWVLGVSRWLDNFSVDNLTPSLEIQDCCWSRTTVREIQVTVARSGWLYDEGTPLPYSDNQQLPAVREVAYKRRRITPAQLALIKASGLTPKELLLGGALAYSKTIRRKRNPVRTRIKYVPKVR